MFEFPQIDPVAFSVGPFSVRWYALSYLAGFILAWRYCMKLADLDDERPDRKDIDDFLVWAIVGVLLGGRLGYVLFYQFEYYAANPVDIFKLWHGGMAFHGGALGVIIALILFSHARQISFRRIGDIVCAGVPIGLFFGRIANFVNGELYGRVTDSPLGIVFPSGGPLPRHPSQLYEAILEGAVLFMVLWALMKMPSVRARPGSVAGTFLAGYAFFRAVVEFFREPDAHLGFVYGAFSMGQLLSVPMIAFGLILIVLALKKRHVQSA